MSENIENPPKNFITHYFISNIFYIFVLVVCPIFIYLYAQHYWLLSALGFQEKFTSSGILNLFLIYIQDTFSIVLGYILWPIISILLYFFYISLSRNKPNTNQLKEPSDFQKKIIALSKKISAKVNRLKKDLYLSRHLMMIFLILVYILIVAMSHDKGMNNGIAAAQSIIQDIQDNSEKLPSIVLQDETIQIYTLSCDKDICSGIQVITNDKEEKELISRYYKAEFYSNTL